MKNRTITKIISCVLCTAISMQVGLALTDEKVNAAESITVEGIVGGMYYHGELTLTAPEGYEMECSHLPAEEYQDSLTIDQEIVGNSDVYFTLRNKSDGTTQQVWLSEVLPEYDLIVDNNPPYTFEELYYLDEEPYQVMTDVYDGAIIKSDNLYLEIEDDYNLDSVVVNVNGTDKYIRQDIDIWNIGFTIADGSTGDASVVIDPDVVNHITITAVDDAENEFSVSFVMLKDLVEFDPTVSVDDILIGGTPVPSYSDVPDDYDGEPDIVYLDGNNNETRTFDTAGTYTVKATFPSTELYAEAVDSNTFEVGKNSFLPEVSVEDFYVGSTPAPSFSNVPDDYDEEPEITYFTEDEEEVSEFNAAGSYYVTVIFPKTDKYEETACNDYFDVKEKESFTPSISVENIEVGDTIVLEPEGFPDDYDGEITYEFKKSTEEDTAYSATYPTAAGEYTVRATFPDTIVYKGTECTDTFTISKKEATATVTVADIHVGETPVPKVTTVSGGDITYEYKLRTAEDTAYSTTVPTAAGEYTVRATVAETDTYTETTCTGTFKILKNEVTAQVSVADLYVGGTVNPVLTVDPEEYDGTPVYEYKSSTDTSYSSTVPTAAGEYTVRVTLPDTAAYKGTECTDTFTISKKEATATVTAANIHVGEEPNPQVTTVSDGDVTIEYKLSSAADTAYSATVPTAAGEYTVRATVAETDTYKATECTGTFKILKNIVSAAVTVADIYVGGTPNPSVTLNSEEYDGDYTVVYENAAGEKVTEFTSAGEYKVIVTIPDSEEYITVTCENTFMVSRKEATATLTVANIHVGETPDPQVTTISDGDITYEYKLSTAADTAYSTAVPTAAGEYTVRATVAETDTYEGTECTGEFSILKNEVTAKVTVADIYVGGTPNPSVTLNSEEYDGDYTVVYENAAGEKVTEFTSAGEYKVIVTIPESEEYVAASCVNTFTVSRKEISATVSVSDIYVGGTVKPVLTVDPEDYDGTVKYEYKLSTEPDTSYSETVPAEAGKYTVRATLSATEIYEGTTCEASFSIRGKEPVEVTAEVSVEDIYVGGTPVPSVKTDPEDYDGTYIVTYENAAGEEVTEFTAAGEYKVIVTLPDSGLFIGTTCEDSFKVSRKNVTASVSVADILVGGTVEPVLTVDPEDYDGKVRYEYKGSADASYSSTVPTAAGTYKVRATLQETDVFEGTECEADFTISKGEVKATVTVADIYVGGTPAPSVKTDPADYDGTPVYEYKLSSDPDTAYSSAVPGTAGTYTVRATLPSTVNYLGTTCTDEFTISKNTVTATVSVADITVGNTPAPVVKTESDGKVIFEYKSSSAPDTAYSSAVPSKAGKYTVRATVEETNRYLSTTCTAEFTISLNKVTKMDLSVPDIFYGQTVSASFDTDSDGAVTIVYKSSGAADSTYSSTAPVKVGSYIAMATVDETDKFESDSCTVAFKISYLDAPATAYTLSGTQGKNGYYTSDVVLNAPQGFSVSASEGGTFSGSIPYSENLNTIYLKRSDGALTAGIAISNKPKIDKAAPSISSSSGISNGAVLFESSVTLTVNDPNLASLKVNGSAVSLSSSGSTVLTLTRPESGFKTFSITAEDEAGNISTFEFTLMAEWLKDKKIPAGQTVSLNAGEVYYLDEGTWIVSIVNSDGTITEGTTVFSGNLPFYVGVTGDYIFTRVT